MLVALGRMDTRSAEEVAATLARLRQVLELSRHHLHKEDQFLHPLMESRQRDSTSLMREQHGEHRILWARFADAELHGIHQAILGSMEPRLLGGLRASRGEQPLAA
jgi:hypothetical protein